ncbi:hypothetical protein SCHPADRAFT_993340 [Schizopora paradoxa]|uniref:Uncharacterized protein n=1 Tax=Schizopora paradoxa TaxID=27342 RepID=A0A0H2S2Z3_9AGAM|nr:hypothetical protein SCHPADRAFT_993340 [Schizopora paradoxa]
MSQARSPTASPSASVSYIPVMAAPVPRKASKGSFGLSAFSLLPSPRSGPRLGSPSQPAQFRQSSVSPSPTPIVMKGDIGQSPSASNSQPSSTPSAIPKFKSLRNMLPFGPKQSSPSSIPGTPPSSFSPVKPVGLTHRRSISSIPTSQSTPKATFLTFGPRKSFTVSVDRKVSAPPSINRSRSEDHGDSPIITISGPTSSNRPSLDSTRLFVKEEDQRSPRPAEDPFSQRTPELSPRSLSEDNIHRDFSMEVDHSSGRSGDLSTIMEAELSSMSMSKHLPPLVEISKDALKPLDINLDCSAIHAPEKGHDSGNNLILAHLAKEVHTRSRTMLRDESIEVSLSPVSPPKAERAQDLSSNWDAELAEFRRSMAVLTKNETTQQDEVATTASESSASPLSASNILNTPSDDFGEVDEPQSQHSLKPQISFNLSSLDPDLAELLSPHNIVGSKFDKSAVVQAAMDAVTGPPMSVSPSPSPEPSPAYRRWSEESNGSARRISLESSKGRNFTPILGPQSSPKKSRPSSLTMSVTSTHSRKAALTESRRASLDVNSQSPVQDNTESPSQGVAQASRTKPRPFLGRSTSALASSSATTRKYGDVRNRPTTSRLDIPDGSPAWAPKSRVVSDGRPSMSSRKGSSEAEEEIASASSSNLERFQSSGPSFRTASRRSNARVGTSERPESSLSYTSRPYRTRRRSMSVTDGNSPSMLRKPLDWMGPRTVRAFTAAGLLDKDKSKDGLATSPTHHAESRAPSTFRSSLDHGSRARAGTMSSSRNAPSRAGFSDISRSDSWGRHRSASRAGTMSVSELTSGYGRVDSPMTATTVSLTPTTTTNTRGLSVSTATSMSIGQLTPYSDDGRTEAALQSLRDKHSLETEALLNALVDSQRSTRELKEENNKLHGRIRDLEEQMRDLIERLESSRRSNHLSQKGFLGRASPALSSRSSSTEGMTRRQHSLMQSFVIPSDEAPSMLDDANEMDGPTVRISPAALRSDREVTKRSSTSSSLFPTLPSNMSMLLHDSDDADANTAGLYSRFQSRSRSTSQPPSPTMQLTQQSPLPGRGHRSKPSVASIESLLSSDGDVTQLSIPGSPGSLRLRPEHEKHLGDMMSLDLSMVDSDS